MAANDIRAGRAYVEVYSKDNTMPGMRAIFNRLGSMSGAIARIGAMASGALTTGVAAAAVYKTIAHASSVKDIADRTGLGLEAVQELSYAAKMSATDMESLETGIKQMQKAIVGGSKSLERLGLSAAELQGLSPDAQFARIADAVSQLSNPAEKTAIAIEIFGKAGTQLIPMLDLGAAGLEKMRNRARELGLVMTSEDILKADELSDALDELGMRWDALVRQVGTAFIPAINEIADRIADITPPLVAAAKAVAFFIDGISDLTPSIQDMIADLLETIADIEFRFSVGGYSASGKPFEGMRDTAKEYRDNAETLRKTARADSDARHLERINRARRDAGETLAVAGVRKEMGTFDARQINDLFGTRIEEEQLEVLKSIDKKMGKQRIAPQPGIPLGKVN